ncbi:MAG: hypothetical protein K0S32_2825 [Bacteroidetes bacterium]|nr:hypothetical protein [Bacteroidota bacterium]
MRVGFNLSVKIFSKATNKIDKAMMGSTILEGIEIIPISDNPKVMECATVKAVACQMMVFNFGLNK